MRITSLKVLTAVLLFGASVLVAPSFWRASVLWLEDRLPSLPACPATPLDDPELALGALLFRAVERRPPEPAWLAAIASSTELRPVLDDYRGWTVTDELEPGEGWGAQEQDPVPTTGFAGMARLARRLQERGLDSIWGADPTELRKCAAEMERLIALPYDTHAHTLNAALLRYLKSQEMPRHLAVMTVWRFEHARAWSEPLVHLSRSMRQVDAALCGTSGSWRSLPLSGPTLRIMDKTGPQSGPLFRHFDYRELNAELELHILLILAAAFTLAMGVMILLPPWLLTFCAWHCLRGRGGRNADRQTRGASPVVWLLLATLGSLTVASSRCVHLLSEVDLVLSGLALGVALDAWRRGIMPGQPGVMGWVRDLLAALLLGALAVGAGLLWDEQLYWNLELKMVLASTGLLSAVGALFIWAAWGLEREAGRRRVRQLLVALVLLALALVSAFGLTGAEQARTLIGGPEAAPMWLAAFGVGYWVLGSVAGRRLAPELLTSYRVVFAIAGGALLTMLIWPEHTGAGVFSGLLAYLTLILVVFGIVFADGARRRALRSPEGIDPAAICNTAAWCAALADGLVLLALVALVASIHAESQQNALTETTLRVLELDW